MYGVYYSFMTVYPVGVPYIYIYIMPNLDAGCSYVVLDTAAIFGHFGGFFCSWQEKSYMAEKN